MATQTDKGTPAAGRDSQRERSLEWLGSHARLLWVVALLSYVGGDFVTTFVGLQYTPLGEVGPLAALLLAEFGFESLVGLKLGFVGLLVVVWKLLPDPISTGVPLGLAVIGSGITAWNAALIALVGV